MTGKVIITGGGTGGHLFPGIALAEEFARRRDGWEVIFIGTGKELEKRILSHWGYKLMSIPSAPLKGKSWWRKIAGLLILWRGVWWSLTLLRRISPRLVIGLGGYSAGGVLLAASLLGIKRVIQEQNVQPGLTNRVASRLSQRVFLSWPEGARFFPPEKARLTGNPLRREVLRGKGQPREGKKFTLLVVGGSQGATAINRAIIDSLPFLETIKNDLRIMHQTGEGDYDWVVASYKEKGVRASVQSFIDEMAPCYREAHLLICRAGAATITEICAWGRASILIPYPYAADDHQRKNAQVLARRGAARMITQEQLSVKELAEDILHLYHDRKALKEMEKRAADLGRPDAAARIVDECYKLLGIN